MTRNSFGGTPADYLVSPPGADGTLKVRTGLVTFWSAETGGVQYTDLLLGGAPTTSIPTRTNGQIPLFSGPDGVGEMWADAGAGRLLIEGHAIAGPAGDRGPAGTGIPAGGAVGQVLTKSSDSDFSTGWATPPGGAALVNIGVRPEDFGAVGDAVTDDSDAFAAMVATNPTIMRLTPGKNYLIAPNVLSLAAGAVLKGESGSGYPVVDTTDGAKVAKITIKSVSGYDASVDATYNTMTPTYWGVKTSTKCVVRDVLVASQNAAAVPYYSANFPGAGNTTGIGSTTVTGVATTGIVAGNATQLIGVATQGFRVGSICGKVVHYDRCFASSCDYGFYPLGTDGWMRDCVAIFNFAAGVFAPGNFWRYQGCRFEWNAHYGLVPSAESTVVGCLFDRNGWAGLYFAHGDWGQVVTGNYFSRNGVGGNGAVGRWQWSVPGNASYVDTPAAESSHIKINQMRRMTITGNSYRAGSDDSGNGATGPVYVYSSSDTNHATNPDNVFRAGNAGERGVSLGYSVSSHGYAGVTGAVAGGTDTTLAADIVKAVSRTGSSAAKTTTSTATGATPAPSGDMDINQLLITALDVATTIGAPTGTPIDGNMLMARIRSDASAHTIAWNAIYTAPISGITLPTTTVASKRWWGQFMYSAQTTKWELIASGSEA